MQLLKDSTRELHEAAESHDFQQGLARGTLAREQFVAYLGQLLQVHSAVEGHLRHLAASGAANGVIRDYHYRVPLLKQDLGFFGVDPEGVESLTATARLVERIDRAAAANQWAVLGSHYVLEGSTHGSKFMVRCVRQAYALEAAQGTSYLDPHGELLRERWLAFKQGVDALDLAPADVTAALAAARQMFEGIVAIGEDVQLAAAGGCCPTK
jgi:heme oxygenase